MSQSCCCCQNLGLGLIPVVHAAAPWANKARTFPKRAVGGRMSCTMKLFTWEIMEKAVVPCSLKVTCQYSKSCGDLAWRITVLLPMLRLKGSHCRCWSAKQIANSIQESPGSSGSSSTGHCAVRIHSSAATAHWYPQLQKQTSSAASRHLKSSSHLATS